MTHPKVPLERFYRYVDLYLAAHAGWHIAPPLAMVAVAYMHVPL